MHITRKPDYPPLKLPDVAHAPFEEARQRMIVAFTQSLTLGMTRGEALAEIDGTSNALRQLVAATACND